LCSRFLLGIFLLMKKVSFLCFFQHSSHLFFLFLFYFYFYFIYKRLIYFLHVIKYVAPQRTSL
jgi:hypothetical protein